MVMVDVGLPGELDGFDVCRALRQTGRGAGPGHVRPHDDEVDRVLGRSSEPTTTSPSRSGPRAGGPGTGHPATHRRPPAPRPRCRRWVGGVEVNAARREVLVMPRAVALTTREFDLLAHLAAQRGARPDPAVSCSTPCGETRLDRRRTDGRRPPSATPQELGDALPLTTLWGVGYRLG